VTSTQVRLALSLSQAISLWGNSRRHLAAQNPPERAYRSPQQQPRCTGAAMRSRGRSRRSSRAAGRCPCRNRESRPWRVAAEPGHMAWLPPGSRAPAAPSRLRAFAPSRLYRSPGGAACNDVIARRSGDRLGPRAGTGPADTRKRDRNVRS